MWIGLPTEFLTWRLKRSPFVIRSNEGLALETSALVTF